MKRSALGAKSPRARVGPVAASGAVMPRPLVTLAALGVVATLGVIAALAPRRGELSDPLDPSPHRRLVESTSWKRTPLPARTLGGLASKSFVTPTKKSNGTRFTSASVKQIATKFGRSNNTAALLAAAKRVKKKASAKKKKSSGRSSRMTILLGAGLAFLSQVSQAGKVMQKKAVGSLPELGALTALQYLTHPLWVMGVLLDVGGGLIGLASLSMLPISVAQPIFCNGLVILALCSYLYLHEQLRPAEWVAIALCFSGTVLLAITLVPTDWSRVAIGPLEMREAGALVLTLPALGALEVVRRRTARPTVGELCAGTQAGLCIGVGNAALAVGLQAIRPPPPHARANAAAPSLFGRCSRAATASSASSPAVSPPSASGSTSHTPSSPTPGGRQTITS